MWLSGALSDFAYTVACRSLGSSGSAVLAYEVFLQIELSERTCWGGNSVSSIHLFHHNSSYHVIAMHSAGSCLGHHNTPLPELPTSVNMCQGVGPWRLMDEDRVAL